MGQLDGKVALITGAARGQGEAEARLFAAEGAQVVMTDVLVEPGEAAAAAIGPAARFVRHDVASEADWAAVVEATLARHGRIDILINNAAIYRQARMEDTSLEDYERICQVNQTGVFLGMKAVVPAMKAQGGGAIVNVASVAGFQGTSGIFAYAASKWAVRGMTKAAALELARYGVRVNAILPGVIDTPILEGNSPQMNDAILKQTPMRRRGRPEEIAQAALYLVSPAASFVTGVDHVVDGGMAL